MGRTAVVGAWRRGVELACVAAVARGCDRETPGLLARRRRVGARRRPCRLREDGSRIVAPAERGSDRRTRRAAVRDLCRIAGGAGRPTVCGILGAVNDVLPGAPEESAVPVSGLAVAGGVLVAYGAFAVLISIVAAFANGAHSHQVLSGATWKQLGTGG